MKFINIYLIIFFFGFLSCKKEPNIKPNDRIEHYIFAGSIDTTVNNYYDYNPDYYVHGYFSIGHTLAFSDSFDIDLDGTLDLCFTNYYYDYIYLNYEGIYTEALWCEYMMNVVYQDSLQISGPFYLRDIVNKHSNWGSVILLEGLVDIYPWLGNENYDNSFMGLQFYKNNDTLYGWLRLSPGTPVYDGAINKIK